MDARNNYLYQSLPKIEEIKILKSIEDIWEDFSKVFNCDNYTINPKVMLQIIERVDKKKAHYKIFHNNMNISEYKEASLYGYWISKMKPVINIQKEDLHLNNINESFAIYYIISTIKKLKKLTEKEFCFNKSFLSSLIYSLKYRNLTEEALITIFDTFYYH